MKINKKHPEYTLFLLFVIFILPILMPSCATIMNQSHTSITVYTTEPSKVVINQDTVETIDNKANFYVERKKETLNVNAITDSLSNSFTVGPKNSSMYWSNIILNSGIGMLVDMNNPKRYSYPQRIYVNSSDTVGRYYKYGQANNKGEMYLHFSLPHINMFQLSPEYERTKSNAGFWGLTVGLDYYHSKNQFINMGVSGVLDFSVPFPAAVDLSGEYELMGSRYISLSNNHHLGRFTLGYGLSFSRNTWDYRYYDNFDPPPPSRDPIKKSHYSIGLIFPTYIQLGEHFLLGAVYRPTFYRPNITDNFKYEHLISVDFAWKFRIKR